MAAPALKVGGSEGAGDFNPGERAEVEVEIVEMEADRERAELDLVETELFD